MAEWNQGNHDDDWDSAMNLDRRKTGSNVVVPDSWEDDDAEINAAFSRPTTNRQLWEDANARAPMPEVLVASSATSTASPIPQAALAGPKMILKRPSKPTQTPSSSSVTSSASGPKTYGDREAAYQAARERIFGTPPPTQNEIPGNADVEGLSTTQPATTDSVTGGNSPKPPTPIRNPRGPPPLEPGVAQPGFQDRKFAGRKGHKRGQSDLDIALPSRQP